MVADINDLRKNLSVITKQIENSSRWPSKDVVMNFARSISSFIKRTKDPEKIKEATFLQRRLQRTINKYYS